MLEETGTKVSISTESNIDIQFKSEVYIHLSQMHLNSVFHISWYFCTCFLQNLHEVLCCYSGMDLHFSHQSTFISRRQNASPSWAVWWLRGPMVFILAYYCLYRWMWYLQAFGNCSQGWCRLVGVYNIFCEVLADFFWFSHDVKQRGTEFECMSWNTSRGTPPTDSNYVNYPIRSF